MLIPSPSVIVLSQKMTLHSPQQVRQLTTVIMPHLVVTFAVVISVADNVVAATVATWDQVNVMDAVVDVLAALDVSANIFMTLSASSHPKKLHKTVTVFECPPKIDF